MVRSGHCGRLWEVDAYREGRLGAKDAESFERHARGCAACGGKLARDEELGRMARELPERGAPTPLALRRLRQRVLRDAAVGESDVVAAPWWRGRAAGVGAVVLAAAVLAVVVGSGLGSRVQGGAASGVGPASVTQAPVVAATSTASPAPEVYAGSVAELGDARWTQTRQDGVERVVLAGGSVRVHVRRQQEGERFLVSLPDGEIEVRGTTFDVSVAEQATTRVHVDEGTVDLRLAARDEVRLTAGDTWTVAPAQPVASPRLPVARVQPARSVAAPAVTAPAPAPAPVDEGESAYSEAVALLRDGRSAEAAAAFQAFVIAHPQAPQTEDASYLEAVALARAGRIDAAALAAEQHLARFPGSFHRREAEALVARARVSGSR
ncbi:MAG TPA: FecR domain-containing protein [Polyangiaceae bacterium]